MCPNRVLKSEEKQNYECSQDTALWSSVRGKADEVVPEVTCPLRDTGLDLGSSGDLIVQPRLETTVL